MINLNICYTIGNLMYYIIDEIRNVVQIVISENDEIYTQNTSHSIYSSYTSYTPNNPNILNTPNNPNILNTPNNPNILNTPNMRGRILGMGTDNDVKIKIYEDFELL